MSADFRENYLPLIFAENIDQIFCQVNIDFTDQFVV